MGNKYQALFKPLKIGQLEIKNRIIMSPMTTYLTGAEDEISADSIAYFAARARGGAGMLMTEACFIDPEENAGSMGFNFTSKRSAVQFAHLADVVHRYGSKLCIQVSAGSGRTASRLPGLVPYSASALPALNPTLICHELTKDEIQEITKKVVTTATKAVMAGADAIDIHAHNGYLLDQFISPQWNVRTDEYGGSVENRTRLPKEIIGGIRAAVGPVIPIIFRISVDHKYPAGRTMENTVEILKELDAYVDAFDIDFGAYESMDYMFPSYYMGTACSADLAKEVRKIGLSKPIMNSGNHTPESAVELLEDGTLDAVMFGRPLVADPDLPNKLKAGKGNEVKPCIRCNEFCLKGVLTRTGIRCSVNAEAGEELYQILEPVNKIKNVVVVGGGPAGCEAAITAAKRGHKVSLYEASEKLGGMLSAAATPNFKSQLQKLIKWDAVMLEKYGVDIHMNHKIDEKSEELKKADQIIWAVGAKELCPPIEGIDSKGVIKIADAHHKRELVKGENIVIAGGGLSGCDFALELVEEGKHITVIEMREKVAADVFPINAKTLLTQLAMKKVQLMTNSKIVKFTEGCVTVETSDGIKEVKADTIVLALGMKTDTGFTDKIYEKYGYKMRMIGDCVKPGKVGSAIRDGYYAGATV